MRNKRNKNIKGYTLVELIISLSILIIITTVTLAGRSSYRDTILFTNLAYDIAQTIRQTQVLAATGKETTSTSRRFDAGYGLFFNTSSNNKLFRIFADYGPDGSRSWHFNDTANEDDLLGTYNIGGGASIQSVCRIAVSGVPDCDESTNIVFLRPDLGACVNDGIDRSSPFVTNVNQCPAAAWGNSSAIITLVSPGGRTKAIQVHSSGQISID